jgi:hypothetical protein
MRNSLLLIALLVAATVVPAQKTVKGYTDESGPKLISAPELQVAVDWIEVDLGGLIRVLVEVDKAGQVSVTSASGPLSPCSNLTDPRALALRDAAIAAAKQATFEPQNKTKKTWIQFSLPHPPIPESEKGKPKYISAGVMNGKADSLVKPLYPPYAHDAGAGGMVSVEVLLGLDGKVLGAAGFERDPLLFTAASEAACQTKFRPTLLQGNPIKVFGTLTYNFHP